MPVRTYPLLQSGPGSQTILDSIRVATSDGVHGAFRCYCAYASLAGVQQLSAVLDHHCEDWETIDKTFIVGLDYGVTEPDALVRLCELPATDVLVYDAARVLARGLVPTHAAYHPKVYLFSDVQALEGAEKLVGVLGSANLTARALNGNVEAAVRFAARSNGSAFVRWREWAIGLSNLEVEASEVTEQLVARYREIREARFPGAGQEKPPGTEVRQQGQLSAADLRALWASRYFWTETLTINRNRGRGREGNQVDLKRGTRRFFRRTGSLDLPPNSPLGSIRIEWQGQVTMDRALRYGNNGMDKVVLPIPDDGGPSSYAHTVLMFERIAPDSYRLVVGGEEATAWIEASMREGSLWEYTKNGRRWGYFSRF